MIRQLILLSICFSVQFLASDGYICNSKVSVEQSPVIGVLAQETWNNGLPPNNSVIVAGYVKFLEMAGAQVVPVLLNKSDNYYDTLYRKLNGLLLPGGAPGSGYSKVAEIFWLKATNNNPDLSWRSPDERERNYFPIWGTCLGMEAMLDMISGEPSRFTRCNAYDTADPVNLVGSNVELSQMSSLFRTAPTTVLNALREKNVTANFHHKCMTPANLTKFGLDKNILVLGKNYDKNGLEYISIFESRWYPFVGVQFHPEAVLFEFKNFRAHHNIPHSLDAIQVSQYFANYFVERTRANKNCFDSQDELNSFSIHNYQPEFTAASKDDRYIQKYFFPL